jgi:serine/threonine protein kinase
MSEANGVAEKTDPQPTATGNDRNQSFDPDATLNSSAAGTLSAAERASERKSIGPYQLIRKLGEGGMGQVWLAEQTAPIKRQVALKLIRVGRFDDSILQRFYAERQSLAMMDHPSIAKVFDAGATSDGQPYFVMEYVPGQPITEYCDRRQLKIRERLELFTKVCEGAQHAHQKAVIHRDLKPAKQTPPCRYPASTFSSWKSMANRCLGSSTSVWRSRRVHSLMAKLSLPNWAVGWVRPVI